MCVCVRECQETLRAVSRSHGAQSAADVATSPAVISSTSTDTPSPAAVTASEVSVSGYSQCVTAKRGLEAGTKLPLSNRASTLFTQLQKRITTNNKT